MSILVVTPTRSRPQRAYESYIEFERNSNLENTETLWVLDVNDSELYKYHELSQAHDILRLWTVEYSGGMIERTNSAAMSNYQQYDITGWGADDLVSRTPGWDERVEEAIRNGALMVGVNDLFYGESKLQTAFFSRNTIKSLGYLLLPESRHLYFDNALSDLAEKLGNKFKYLPDVVFEHVHPSDKAGSGTIPWDDQYREIHQPENYARDRAAYEIWRNGGGLDKDVEAVLTGMVN